MHKVQVYKASKSSIQHFMIGGSMLFALSEGGSFKSFDLKTGEVLREIQLEQEPSHFMHPMTYINKFLFFSKDQGMQLWNVVDSKKIYSFEKGVFAEKRAVTCVVQSPVVNIVAVGFSDGLIAVVDL